MKRSNCRILDQGNLALWGRSDVRHRVVNDELLAAHSTADAFYPGLAARPPNPPDPAPDPDPNPHHPNEARSTPGVRGVDNVFKGVAPPPPPDHTADTGV